ncbi:MAG TPA: hypothetical protein VKS81_06395, partial [Bacteroidota bacterium]|nr:hypothetical protein [Bacteroidota bacterium]
MTSTVTANRKTFNGTFLKIFLLLVLIAVLGDSASAAIWYRAKATGNWNSTATWDSSANNGTSWITTVHTTTPGNASSDVVFIEGGVTVRMPSGLGTISIARLDVDSMGSQGSSAAQLSFSGATANTTTLAISGDFVTSSGGTTGSANPDTIFVNGATITVGGNLTIDGVKSGGSRYAFDLLFGSNGGSVTVTGNVTVNNAGQPGIIDMTGGG